MKPFQISFLGDISLNNEYEKQFKLGKNPFENVAKILSESDFVIGNLECVSRGIDGENNLKKPRLNTSISTLNYLKDINLSLALLANNHIYDNLNSGFDKTVKFLQENDIAFIGAGYSAKDAKKPFLKKFNNQTLAIFNYVTRDTNPNIPLGSNFHVNWFDLKEVIKDIMLYSNVADKIILCLHWGGKCEGGFYPDWPQPKIAKKLIDCGADLIVGCHSHTFQPYQKYKGKMIYYSLGNFCFSDIIFEGKVIELDRDKRTDSAIVNLVANSNSWNFDIVPFNFDNLTLTLDGSLKGKFNFRNSLFKFFFKYKFVWDLYFFKFKYIDPIKFYLFGNKRNPVEQIKNLNLFNFLKFISFKSY